MNNLEAEIKELNLINRNLAIIRNDIHGNARQFPVIIDWLKSKTVHDPKFITKIISENHHKIFLSKFMQRHKINISATEFIEMFWNECYIMKITSTGDEKNIVEGYIHTITEQYEAEKKNFIDTINEEKKMDNECYSEIENHFRVVELTPEDLKTHFHFNDRSGFIANCYQKLKRNVYNKYRAIYCGPHTYDDLVTITETEKAIIMNEINVENQNRETQQLRIFADNEAKRRQQPRYERMPPLEPISPLQKTYKKQGFHMSYKELIRAVENKACSICTIEYTDADSIIFLEKCKHTFHKECIEKWSKASCPICRTSN